MTPVYDKIVKLLRTAERAEGNEAEVALMMAQKLATQHQVDLATINTSEGEQERKEEFIQGETEYSEKSLAVYIQWILTNHFRVRTCYNRSRVFFVGRKSDVVFAEFLFGWLMDRFMTEWREEKRKSNHTGGRRSAKAFFYGMYQGLDGKLKTAKRETEDSRIRDVAVARSYEAARDSGTPWTVAGESQVAAQITSQYQLAVVKEEDELEKEYNRVHPSARSRSSMSYSRGQGIAAGRAAGARTSIPGLPLNNSSRSALS